MFKVLYLIEFVLIFSSCISHKKEIKSEQSSEILIPWLSKFRLPLQESIQADSNSFVFFKEKNFDTSYLFHLHKDKNIVLGIYYEVPPEYSNNLSTYKLEKNQNINFKGVAFQIEQGDLAEIINQAEKVTIGTKQDYNTKSGCFDCAYYFLSFRNKMTGNVGRNLKQFEFLDKYIKNNFINKLNSR